MTEIQVDPAVLAQRAQALAAAALAVDDVGHALRRPPWTGDGRSSAALAHLAAAVDQGALDLAEVVGDVAVTLGDVALAYAVVDGQGR